MICAAVAAGHASAYDTVAIADAMRDPQPDGASTRLVNIEQKVTARVGASGAVRLSGSKGAVDLVLLGAGSNARTEVGDDLLVVRDDVFAQHWLNTPRGLEHIIEVFAATDVLDLRVSGLAASLLDERTVILRDGDGSEALRYSGLAVFDALSRHQTAWFEVTDSSISVHVEADADAVYPLIVDPIVTSPTALGSNEAPDADFFGGALAVGDLTGDSRPELVVGLPFDSDAEPTEGSIAIFTPDVNNNLTFFTARTIGNFSMPEAMCGRSLAIGNVTGDAANDIVVGCPGASDASDDDGAIVIFVGPSIPTLPTVRLRDDTPTTGSDRLADTGGLALQNLRTGGNLDVVATKTGALLTYDLAGGTTPTVNAITAGLRPRVAALKLSTVGGEAVVVGRLASFQTFTAGAVPSPGVTFTTPSNGAINASRVAAGDIDGDGDDDIVVGAPENNSGAGAFTVVRTNTATTFTTLGTINGTANQRVGGSVFVGNLNRDRRADYGYCAAGSNGNGVAGHCSIFGGEPPSGTLDGIVRLSITDPAALSGLGETNPVAGDFANDGAPDLVIPQPAFNGSVGQVAVYPTTEATLRTSSFARPNGTQVNGNLGRDFIVVGDVNQDGSDDVLTSEPGYQVGGFTTGALHLTLGGPGMDNVPDWTVEGTQFPVRVIGSTATIGRFRGLSSPPSIAIQVGGSVFVFHAATNGVPPANTLATANQVITPSGMNGSITSLANGGNMVGAVTGNGESLIVGAPAKTGGGQVFIFRSAGTGGLQTTASQTLLESATTCPLNSGFGSGVANVRDVNRDTNVRDDLIVTANECGTNKRGRAFLFTGGASAVSSTTWSFSGTLDNTELRVPAAIGDFNGDTRADFALGGPGYNGRGRVWLFTGSNVANTLPSTTEFGTITGTSEDKNWGSAIAGGKDINRDGFSDLIIGSPGFSNDIATPNEGRIFAYAGDPVAFRTLHVNSGNCSECKMGAAVGMGRFDSIPTTPDRGLEDAAWSAPGMEDTAQNNEGVVVMRIGIW